MLKQYLLSAILLGTFGINAEKSAEDVIIAIMPKSKECESAKDFRDECRTAKQAAPFLVEAFKDYQIYSPFEIGAVLSLIGLESADLRYNINHFPGRHGQGTRNMMMIDFVREYIQSIPALKDEYQKTLSKPQGANETMDEQRALVLDDKYSFASGAWFLVKHCPEVRAELQKGTDAGWESYNKCVTKMETVAPERTEYWTRAKNAWKQ